MMKIVGFTVDNPVQDIEEIREICEERDMNVYVLDGNVYDSDTGSLIAIPVSDEDHLESI